MGIADEFADAFKSVTKDLAAEKKKRERDYRRSERDADRYAAPARVTLKEIVFIVLPAAIDAATGGGVYPVSARTLFYQVRPRLQEYTRQELEYAYFSQQLLPDYQTEYGPIGGLYYEARGELHEPHTGTSVPLGTREVASYAIPDWTFDKVLYVEKAGLWPVLKAAKLAERYDMAVIAGNGYATEACRDLLARAEGRDITVFVLHDADPAGYNIARTLGEETRRMPDHYVEVVDLGLSVADAIAHNLPTETFTRKRELPWTLVLDDTEREWFQGRRVFRDQFSCIRVELNAFTGPDLVAYVEAGLEAADATNKVIPPDDVIGAEADKQHHATIRDLIEQVLADTIDLDEMVSTIVAETATAAEIGVDDVTEALGDNEPISWRDAVENLVDEHLDETEDQVRRRIRELLTERLAGREDGGD